MTAGLEYVDEGTILIGDRNVNGVPSRDRDVALVFQNYALYPHMTVTENMGFALKMRGVKKNEIRSRVADAAKLLDLEDDVIAATAELLLRRIADLEAPLEQVVCPTTRVHRLSA